MHRCQKRFGLAWGMTFAILYLECVLVMTLVAREAIILFFNSLFHGLDLGPIIRMDAPCGRWSWVSSKPSFSGG